MVYYHFSRKGGNKMCVIVYKPEGVDIVEKDILQKCFERNGDGAGFAYRVMNNETNELIWQVYKGLMTFDKFWKHFGNIDFKKEHEYICHFRIKTHGNKDAGNTHPFPTLFNYNKMRKTNYCASEIVFHNGSCGFSDGIASDTMHFIKYYISPLKKYKDDKKITILLEKLLSDTGDKWLIADNEHVSMYGKWMKEKNVYYSNLSWKTPFTTIYTSPYNVGTPNTPISSYNEETHKKVGVVDDKGRVIWEDETKGENNGISMCPHCFEDNALDESPYEKIGDSLCLACGAVFNDTDGKVWMWDEDIKAQRASDEKKTTGT
jgi:hypothetical protein